MTVGLGQRGTLALALAGRRIAELRDRAHTFSNKLHSQQDDQSTVSLGQRCALPLAFGGRRVAEPGVAAAAEAAVDPLQAVALEGWHAAPRFVQCCPQVVPPH